LETFVSFVFPKLGTHSTVITQLL